MDAISSLDLRGRLIFLFRYLKVDTVSPSTPGATARRIPTTG
jgi:hypothetical protein